MNFVLEIYHLFGAFTKAANAQVTWPSNFPPRILDRKKLKYKEYNDFLKGLDSSCRVREVINQHMSAQQKKTQAMK
jgi:hypothetical protein